MSNLPAFLPEAAQNAIRKIMKLEIQVSDQFEDFLPDAIPLIEAEAESVLYALKAAKCRVQRSLGIAWKGSTFNTGEK
jgi:hypothetical protein